MAGLEAFKGVNTATDAQKGALVSLIGQMGSAGAEAYKADQAVAQQAAKAGAAGVSRSNPGIGNPAAASAVGPGQLTQMLAARAAEPGMTAARGAGEASAEFSQYAGLLGKGNSNYADAVKGAAPIVESQTRAEVSQIMADLAAKREAMQYEADQRAIAAREAREDREWELRKRGWELDDRKNDPNAPGGPAPLNSEWAGAALGLDPKKTANLTRSEAYSFLKAEAARLYEQYPNLDPQALQGMLVSADNTLVDPSNPAAGEVLPGRHPEVMALVLAEMAPLLGQTANADIRKGAYDAFGKAMPGRSNGGQSRSSTPLSERWQDPKVPDAKLSLSALRKRRAAKRAGAQRNEDLTVRTQTGIPGGNGRTIRLGSLK